MLEALILSGALIGLPARISDVFPERNALMVTVTLTKHRIRFGVHFPSDCRVKYLLTESQTVHFAQLKADNGVLFGYAQECPV